MILCIDIGNTNISYAIWDNNFSSINRIETKKYKTIFPLKNKIQNIAITSVVPTISDYYKNYLNNEYQIKPFIVNYKNCGINLNVEKPSEVGPDRICNSIGAKNKYGSPSLIIDFGSATTYDIVDKNGDFIGGAIAPGIDVSANNLIKKAALLNETIFKFPNNVIGKNTNTNLQSGIMYGGLDAVQGMIKRIINELNEKNIQIILTGGFSSLISKELNINHTLDEYITLHGLRKIYTHNHE